MKYVKPERLTEQSLILDVRTPDEIREEVPTRPGLHPGYMKALLSLIPRKLSGNSEPESPSGGRVEVLRRGTSRRDAARELGVPT